MFSTSTDQGGEEKTMDWMYKGPTALIDREDYLLGRKVDKSFQMLEAAEKGGNSAWLSEAEKDLTPQSILKSTGPAGPVDVIRKIKDDPLYQIQKKEQEYRKQLLQNPVLLKKLQQHHSTTTTSSATSSTKNSKKKKEKKVKKKKHRKHHKNDSDNDDSSSTSDDDSSDEEVNLLLSKLTSSKNFEVQLKQLQLDGEKKSRDPSQPRRKRHDSSSGDSDVDNRHTKKDISLKAKPIKRYRSKSRSRSPRDVDNRHTKKDVSLKDKSSKRYVSKSRSRSPRLNRGRRRHEDERRFEHRSPRSYHSHPRKRSRSPPAFKGDNEIRNYHGRDRVESRNYHRNTDSSGTKMKPKLDEEEMERRRQEMMGNAKQRDEERERVVQKHREEIRKEHEVLEQERKKNKNASFITKQLAEAANSGSVEQRVKSNSYNIQRSKFAMDNNFARR